MREEEKLAKLYKFIKDPFKIFGLLTDRERQAANLAVNGLTIKEIANVFEISRDAAASYFTYIKLKTGMSKKELGPWVIKMIREILDVG